MPELPEIETACRGITPHILGHTITQVTVRDGRLRWPVPARLGSILRGHTVLEVTRRAKYILVRFEHGWLILHLGMSGSLRVVPAGTPYKKHDHVDIQLDTGQCLRLHDPRRFGAVLWTTDKPEQHKLLSSLGPEPLSRSFNGKYLYTLSRKRTQAIKTFIMDSHTVVGVGNIYANEALFLAGIRPGTPANTVSLPRYNKLITCIKQTLKRAIKLGGTTLRDFVNSDGNPGYFQQTLNVYDRKGEPCRICGRPIHRTVMGQRATYYCGHCQH
jgi:formamidopyrimidine-DNA glycosylase